MTHIDHFESYRTYAGCLEGVPPLESVYNDVHKKANRHGAPVHILQPIIQVTPKKGFFGPYESLPSWTHIAYLSSFTSIEGGSDGSHLVIVWFSEEPLINVDDIVGKVDWNVLAKDFSY